MSFKENEFEQGMLETRRTIMEPITEFHAKELWELFNDPELHTFVPYEPLTLEKQRERCARWSKRCSPDGIELWLNWAVREKITGKIIGHIQSGVKEDSTASIAYVIAQDFQNQGFATECLTIVFDYLRTALKVREVKAWSDSRNKPSHELAKKLGMTQIALLKDADSFKGSTSDEYVFSKILS